VTLFGRNLEKWIDLLIVLLILGLAVYMFQPAFHWLEWLLTKKLPALLGIPAAFVSALWVVAQLAHSLFAASSRKKVDGIDTLFSRNEATKADERNKRSTSDEVLG